MTTTDFTVIFILVIFSAIVSLIISMMRDGFNGWKFTQVVFGIGFIVAGLNI